MFNYIIFHRGCLDGYSGFFIAHMSGKLTKDVIIYPDVPSTKKIPPGIENKRIIIIDVAYKNDVLKEIFKYAQSVVFIDHHITIRDDINNLIKTIDKSKYTIIYDEKYCGATLAWKYFYPRHKYPLFLDYVQDNDTGTWVLADTKPFILALKSYYMLSTEKKNINKWFRLLNKEHVDYLIEQGKIIEKYNIHLLGVSVRNHSKERFPSIKVFNKYSNYFKKAGQYTVLVFNGFNNPSVSELGEEALKRYEGDFCIMWVLNLDRKEYILSMRSKNVDVGSICKLFGGGGHTYSAACSLSAKEWRIEDMFFEHSLPREG